MKIAYFDCSSGVSGDMIMSALIDAGLSEKYLVGELKKLSIGKFTLKFTDIQKNGLHTKFAEISGGEQLREFSKIKKIIKKSKLRESIKQQGLKIYSKIAEAESKAHSIAAGKVHFHEIAEIDTVIDIFGAVIGLDALKIEKVYSSPFNLGRPAPATVEIIKGIPVYSTDDKNEFTTPTAAAIISTLAEKVGPIPEMKIEKTGMGAGTSDFEKPNILRVYIGSSDTAISPKNYFSTDEKILLETNIDDMDSRIFPYIMDKLFSNGAVDVWMTNIYSKKGRPGIILSVLAQIKDEKKLADIIFYETTTLGIRRYPTNRWTLTRKKDKIYKVAKLGNSLKQTTEYEDAVKIAKRTNIPLREIL
ncbi:MAG: TIGR00299 family protein [Elusimicrobia bacterium CG06_land_8_20_14_3_00_38_11]|nr:MAG: TIGR00299 family protein [Elusimicrobia bacterium CG06_land_8_20_14_3_00_38_11]